MNHRNPPLGVTAETEQFLEKTSKRKKFRKADTRPPGSSELERDSRPLARKSFVTAKRSGHW